MITKEDFESSKKIVEEYNIQVNKSLVKDFICISCKTNEIKQLDSGYVKVTELGNGMWSDGTVERISFGYGSKNDCKSFYIAICDDCINQLEKDGFAVNLKRLRKEEKEKGL